MRFEKVNFVKNDDIFWIKYTEIGRYLPLCEQSMNSIHYERYVPSLSLKGLSKLYVYCKMIVENWIANWITFRISRVWRVFKIPLLKHTDLQTLELFCAPTLMDTKKVRSRQMPTGRCCSCTKPYRWSRFDALYTEYTRCQDCRTTWELKVKRALKLTMKFLKNGGNPFYTASFLNRA